MFALGIDGNDTPQDLQQAFARLVFTAQHGAGRLEAAVPGLARLPGKLLLHAHRPEQRAGGRCTEDPQADLGTARHRLIEYLQGLVDCGQGNDCSGVAGQHEGIGPGAAQLGRGRGAQGQPQRQRDEKKPWCLREKADEQH